MGMTSEELVADVAAHAGVPIERADSATRIVLSAFGGYLNERRRRELANELPLAMQCALFAPVGTAVPLAEHLLVPGERIDRARELIASICHVLATELSDEALNWLWLSVPTDLAALLERPAHEARPQHVVAGARDTLATGRPGSHRSIVAMPAIRTQSESVASTNPHGATKLSSSEGSTQERRHETLADVHGDPRRSLSSSKP